jgi:hypothetical protein
VRAENEKGQEIQDIPESKEEKAGLSLPSFLKPLTDFGVGKKSVWEGGVGLFVLVGAGTLRIHRSVAESALDGCVTCCEGLHACRRCWRPHSMGVGPPAE